MMLLPVDAIINFFSVLSNGLILIVLVIIKM